MINLTLAIPTYERPNYLENLLNSIKSEIYNLNESEKELITIYISDNSRNFDQINLNQTIVTTFNKHINNIKYEYNKFNIGGNQNILKCIEYPESGWVWVIGDDDILLKNSLKYILDLIQINNELGSMTFCSTQLFINPPNEINDIKKLFISNNVQEYLDNVFLNNACFIACNLYNTKYYKLFSDRMCESTFTQFPHLVYTLMCLDSGFKNLISNKVIVASLPPTWDKLQVESRLFSLFLIPFKNKESITSIKKLILKQRPNFYRRIAFFYRNILNNSHYNEYSEVYYNSIYKYSNFKSDLLFSLYKFIISIKSFFTL
jgi:hypothetical protein